MAFIFSDNPGRTREVVAGALQARGVDEYHANKLASAIFGNGLLPIANADAVCQALLDVLTTGQRVAQLKE